MSVAATPLFKRILANSPFSPRELIVLIATAPTRYKDHFIDKRHGRGRRLISQPTAELKFLQRFLVQEELQALPIHEAAVAYRPGGTIRNHAEPHAKARYLLKLDFRDFFPSLKASALNYRIERDANYSEVERWILCQLLCRKAPDTGLLQLSIGAPSSPFISNYLMREFDERLSAICTLNQAKYSRYADDLAISTSQPHTLDTIESEIRHLLTELAYLGISLNESKKVNVSKKNQRSLVGLTLSNIGNVSIGRSEKRLLRAMVHAYVQGKLSPEQIAQLRGKLAFVQSIDAPFVLALCERHHFSSINEIRAVPNA